MTERRVSIWVGVIVVFSLVAFGLAYGFLSRALELRNTYTFDVVFDDSEGIEPGAEVRMAGVRVGTVTDVSLTEDQRARVTLRVRRGVEIGHNFRVSITAGLIVGDKAVVIRAGPKPYRIVGEGDTIYGRRAAGVGDILGQITGVLGDMKRAAVSLSSLVTDPAIQTGFKATIDNVTQASEHFQGLLGELENAAVRNRGQIDDTFAEIKAAAASMREVLDEVRRTIDESISEDQLRQMQEALAKAAKNLEDATSALQKLVTEDEVQSDVRTTLSNVRDTSTQAKELTEKLNRMATSAEKTTESVGRIAKESELSFNFFGYMDEHRYRGDLDLWLAGSPQTYYRLGVWDAGETNRANVQIGRKLSQDLGIRYGLYGSRLGVGLDYWSPEHGFRASLDVYRPNDIRSELRLKQPITDDLSLVFGIDDFLEKNKPLFGLEYRR
jgi:phospholipid/cholesterol/gamma-HCH transport system substrate-binding protein